MKSMKPITLRQWLQSEPFTLTLSSGFFSFFAHVGMLSALEAEKLLPVRISGASSGIMVGALWASGCPAYDLQTQIFDLSKQAFWDPGLGLGLLRGRKFRDLLARIARVPTLEACRLPVVVSVFDAFARQTRVLRCGPLADTLYASCAVPFLFQPIRINGRLYWDGGIQDRPGLAGIESGARVFYHHIVSRSPWRCQHSPALQIPQRANMQTLTIYGLPRVGPNHLEIGKLAFEQARRATYQALAAPIHQEQGEIITVTTADA